MTEHFDLDRSGVQAFGEWDAPITDGATWIEVPAHLKCMHCREQFREGDNGCINETGWPAHRECSLRTVMGGIGHLVNHEKYCKGELGTDAGLTYRQSAVLVWWLYHGHEVTEAELEVLRTIEHDT